MQTGAPADISPGQSFPTIVSLYFNAIFALTVLIGVNFCLRQFSVRLAFSNVELLALYIMLVVASAVAGHDTLQILWPMVTYPIWFSTPENEWAIFHPYIPDWLTIKDKSSLTPFYQGDSSLHVAEHLALWFPPILWWSVFFIILTLAMLFIVVLIRAQWIRHEKLSLSYYQDANSHDGGRGEVFQKQADVGRLLYRRRHQPRQRFAFPLSQGTKSWRLMVRHRNPV